MLQINRQTDYAARVILALAKRPPGTRLASGHIQREMLIPKALMPRIVAQLAANGLARTFAGRGGGLELPRPAAEITLKDVVEAFEGPILLSECLQPKGETDCPFRAECPVRSKWGRVQAAMLREMESVTFESLAQEAAGAPPTISIPS
ncbi:MAG: transcriptional regulator [Anaerolineaceae bacterium]|nr:Rrf2 family transcriptional regulator [Anaerolineae bacterium]MBL1172420.1 Rrf2 family transcriptional regulator [Chloroflexota bacterium]MDL1925019.1 Rrf2 family transcriptional regulator [Anaerolineae bacterium AMX1]WKZ53436.1 MAG: Rrf2 family transcriptional regulator [Anaerolineales bacterium]GJQ38994.1 MAG: transcriptional regulator [Anaerolineaceae bacterium]